MKLTRWAVKYEDKGNPLALSVSLSPGEGWFPNLFKYKGAAVAEAAELNKTKDGRKYTAVQVEIEIRIPSE